MSILSVTAPSGIGKSTFMKTFLEKVPESALLTSTTTRAKRDTDLTWKNASEYEHISVESFIELAESGAFLSVFGKEYGNRYGTKKELFFKALRSDTIYLAGLFIPAAELFLEKAKESNLSDRLFSVYLDLDDERERLRRLGNRGESSLVRFEPELERWRKLAKSSRVPFLFLDASHTPEVLVEETLQRIQL